jgi:hypothetical protein
MRKLTIGICFVGMLFMAVASAQAQRAESNVHKRQHNGGEVQSERDEQEALFNWYFRERDLKFVTKYEDLKTAAMVPKWRVPYSAEIHPESAGGLSSRGGRSGGSTRTGLFGRQIRTSGGRSSGNGALSKYDTAFSTGRSANEYEQWRLSAAGPPRYGLFGRRLSSNGSGNEGWEGYCSGFTSATIRHPEPVRAVDARAVGGRAGVVFQPHDIKALLSCIYNRTTDDSYLYVAPASGGDGGPNMGTFHLAITNYVGQAGCPIGIDRTKGRVAWNNPIYSYKVNSVKNVATRGGITYKRLNTTLTYSFYGSDTTRQTDAEGNRVNLVKQSKNYDYVLALNKDGEIVGGKSYSDSGHFLWIGLFAVQASKDQKAPGNPNIDVRRVLALARASAMPEVQKKYDEAGIVMGPRVDPVFEVRRLAAIAKAAAEKRAREEALAKAEEERRAAEAAAVAAAQVAADEAAAAEAATAAETLPSAETTTISQPATESSDEIAGESVVSNE